MTRPTITRTEALTKAVDWAKSAAACYSRAAQANDDARLTDTGRPPVALPSPETRRLTHIAETEYQNAGIEASLASAWAAIAAVSSDPIRHHFEVTVREEPQS
ncbi:hypothetical protein ACFC58_36330 [Kitasatospora purpeofusca]|uniref:hypothetical protein n=1 Tax=Kitasatospora purpeofusca TaxID=67352 RepID=UPI0035DC0A02